MSAPAIDHRQDSTPGTGRAQVWFVADDFGLDAATNEAIVHAWRDGALDGAALMLGQPGTDDAIDLARRNPGLAVGWHLHLCDSRPVTQTAWPWGASPARAGWAVGLRPGARALARREVEAQWSAFCASGLECRFVNAHHHLHAHPYVFGLLERTLPADFAGWVRGGRPQLFTRDGDLGIGARIGAWLQARRRGRTRLALSDSVWGIDRTFAMRAAEVRDVLPRLGSGLHEFLFHPRRKDDADTRCLLELAGDRS